jgi:hypothetical protein
MNGAPLDVQRRNDCSHQGGHNPRLVVANVFKLERGARAVLALKPGAAMNDGVVAE